MNDWELAQLNIARALAPLGSPLLADFIAALDDVNRLAEASAGFVWRLQTEAGNSMDVRLFDDDRLIVNLSVWRSVEELSAFVFRSAHAAVMRKRRTWFEPPSEASTVLFWVPAGCRPELAEASARLLRLREEGPTPRAFTFAATFAPPAL